MERKYFLAQKQIQGNAEERRILLEERAEVEHKCSVMEEKLISCRSTEREFAKQVAAWKKKLLQVKAQLDAKDRIVAEKTTALQSAVDEFRRFRKQQRAKDLKSIMAGGKDSDRESEHSAQHGFSETGQLAVLRADHAAVKNQLVRAESDNLLLVRALEISKQNEGQLPLGIRQEVNRITIRVTKESAPPSN